MNIPLLISLMLYMQVTNAFPGDSQKFRNIASDKLGDTYSILLNSDSTYLIAYNNNPSLKEKSKEENRAGFPLPTIKFFIYNINNSEVLFEDNLPNGEVSWLNREQVKIQTEPGIVKANDYKSNTGYIYDVVLKKKLKINKEVHQR